MFIGSGNFVRFGVKIFDDVKEFDGVKVPVKKYEGEKEFVGEITLFTEGEKTDDLVNFEVGKNLFDGVNFVDDVK